MFGERVKERIQVDVGNTLYRKLDEGGKQNNSLLVQDQNTIQTSDVETGWFPKICAHLLVESQNDDGEVEWKLFNSKNNRNKSKSNEAFEDSLKVSVASDEKLMRTKGD